MKGCEVATRGRKFDRGPYHRQSPMAAELQLQVLSALQFIGVLGVT
jgi:hypothetical protein